jgi:cation transporter-like permease
MSQPPSYSPSLTVIKVLKKWLKILRLLPTGVGQNISSIYVSRLSTFLHLKTGNPGTRRQEDSLFEELQETSSFTVSEEQQISNNHMNNRESAETRRLHNRIQRTLVFLTLPLQILMILAMWIFNLGHTKITIAFVSLYLSGSLLLSWLLIPISKVIVLNIWKRGMNPDNHALPYTSSICDLIGTALLLIIFIFVHAITHE